MEQNFKIVDSGTYNRQTSQIEPLIKEKIISEKKQKVKWLNLLFKINKLKEVK